jgi:hypothetical protein
VRDSIILCPSLCLLSMWWSGWRSSRGLWGGSDSTVHICRSHH